MVVVVLRTGTPVTFTTMVVPEAISDVNARVEVGANALEPKVVPVLV